MLAIHSTTKSQTIFLKIGNKIIRVLMELLERSCELGCLVCGGHKTQPGPSFSRLGVTIKHV